MGSTIIDSHLRQLYANQSWAILLALLLDRLLGDPPSRVYPVAWMGQWINLIRRHAPHTNAPGRFLYGTITIGGGALALGRTGHRLQHFWRQMP